MSREVHRLVRNQILFREVNERVRETVDASDEPLDFVCECSNEDCIETVSLRLGEYEAIRSYPNIFVVVTGHEIPAVERIIDQGQGYVLVEKTVDADKVRATDPRSREA